MPTRRSGPPPVVTLPLGPDGLLDVPLTDDQLNDPDPGRRAVYSLFNTTGRGFVIGPMQPPAAPVARLSIDLSRLTVTLDGKSHDVDSRQALRWVKVLADRPGMWISGRELEAIDSELVGAKTDRLKDKLPIRVRKLINSETGRGSRIRL